MAKFNMPADNSSAQTVKPAASLPEIPKAPLTAPEQVTQDGPEKAPGLPQVIGFEPGLTTANPSPTGRPPAFYVASRWAIIPVENTPDVITAVHQNFGDKFLGTIADFNKLMRGE